MDRLRDKVFPWLISCVSNWDDITLRKPCIQLLFLFIYSELIILYIYISFIFIYSYIIFVDVCVGGIGKETNP